MHITFTLHVIWLTEKWSLFSSLRPIFLPALSRPIVCCFFNETTNHPSGSMKRKEKDPNHWTKMFLPVSLVQNMFFLCFSTKINDFILKHRIRTRHFFHECTSSTTNLKNLNMPMATSAFFSFSPPYKSTYSPQIMHVLLLRSVYCNTRAFHIQKRTMST